VSGTPFGTTKMAVRENWPGARYKLEITSVSPPE
jgi:hypothetical protein